MSLRDPFCLRKLDPKLLEQKTEFVGQILDALADRPRAGVPQPRVVFQQHRPVGGRRGLQERGHLPGVQRIDARVGISRLTQHRRIFRPRFDVLIGRVRQQRLELLGIF